MKKALKKALFIDRDGTLIVEPPVDMQVYIWFSNRVRKI